MRLADAPLGWLDCSVPRHAGSCSSAVPGGHVGSELRGRAFPGPGPGPGCARREAQVAAGCKIKLGNRGGVREEKNQSLTGPQLHE